MAASSVTVETPAENEIKQPQIQDGLKNTDNYAMAENDNAMERFLKSILQKSSGDATLQDVFEKLFHLTSSSESSLENADLDRINVISLLANNLKGYLRILSDEKCLPFSEDIYQETHSLVSNLFCLESGFTYFHDVRSKGIIHICKLALYTKFTKYSSDGFAALYTRPPVIYVSAAAPQDFGKELRTQLGLPQSSICKVPCNTMLGSPYTMDVAAFDRLLTDDVSCGKTPLILICYAGTPVTGHTDNLTRLREICTQSGVWLHIEGDSLATLSLPKAPPSIAPSTSADSFTLDLPDWLASPNIPYCTYYKTSNSALAQQSGLVPKEIIEKLTCFSLWSVFQQMGLDEIKSIIINASELAQQLSHRLDMVSGIKRLEQSNVVSPVVVFRYKAAPAMSYSSSSSIDEDDDLSPVNSSKSQLMLSTKTAFDVSPKLSDALNHLLSQNLEEENKKVRIQVKQISREGSCITFNPLKSARALKTTKDDVDQFVAQLEQEIMRLDSTLIARSLFQEHFASVPNVVLVDVSDSPAVGAFQCVPKYWKVKDLSNLSDSKKREANSLNDDILEKLSEDFQNLNLGKSSSGQVYIQIGLVDDSFDVNSLADKVTAIADEMEDNSKFLETISDAVQEKIHEAEAGLLKESEEKFFEEGVLRNVPVFGSVYNWFSPPVESRGVTGRAFNLASGKLESTEKTYKYKMQLQNDEEAEQNDTTSSSTDDAASSKPDDAMSSKPDDAASSKPDDAASSKPDDAASSKSDDPASSKPDDAISSKDGSAADDIVDDVGSTEMHTGVKSIEEDSKGAEGSIDLVDDRSSANEIEDNKSNFEEASEVKESDV